MEQLLQIKAGDVKAHKGQIGEHEVSLFEYGGHWKSGLVVKGIRAVIFSFSFSTHKNCGGEKLLRNSGPSLNFYPYFISLLHIGVHKKTISQPHVRLIYVVTVTFIL